MKTDDKKKIRVLLVEDDEDDYILTKQMFSDIGDNYEIDWVRTFDAAMGHIAPDCHDICLLDYRLGEYNGLDVLAKLRERGYTCPMILLTGQNDREIDEMALNAGASDYLVKGQLNASVLERAIRYAIQHKQLENERIQHFSEQEARIQAESANRAKDDFLAVLSHELRTPLNAMLGWARLLRTNRHNDDIFNRAVDAIERSANVQTKFVEDLMDVTRIANGTFSISKEPVDLSGIVVPAIDGVRPAAAAKSITIRSSIDTTLVPVYGDADRLSQVVNNLLSNAIKFTPDGGKISITLERIHGNAVVKISDSGEGISKEFLPQVFDRYRQAGTSATDRKGGLGLGLAIVRHLVEMHRGTVKAESDGVGKGSTFTIILPLHQARIGADEDASSKADDMSIMQGKS